MLQAYNHSDHRSRCGHQPLRHGRFTSPHLIDRWDGITISSKSGDQSEPVSSELFHEVERSVLTRCHEENLQATEFELLTATAFDIFNRSHLDVAVVEVGVGGRLDSTNIIGQPVIDGTGANGDASIIESRPLPLVTAIVKIGMDHQGLLGDTIEAIAREKAGIVKPGVPLVYDTSNESQVQNVLEATAKSKESPVVDGSVLKVPDMPSRWANHTRENMKVAFLATWTALVSLERVPSRPPSDENDADRVQDLQSAMLTAAEDTVFPGRQEWVDISSLANRKESVLLDGAHNPQSALVLANKVLDIRISEDWRSNKTGRYGDPVTWVVAMSKGKPLDAFWEPLLKAGDNVFAVEFGPVDGMPWVQPTPALDIIKSARAVVPDLGVTESYGRDVIGALQAASAASNILAGRHLVIAGSLYLVGDVHRHLREKRG